jgi:hypothetical protein
VLADGARLPLSDGVADAVVLVNCFLFPAEVDRVLSDQGVVVWVNSSGGETPIHLPPEDVLAALPGTWESPAGVADPASARGAWPAVRPRESVSRPAFDPRARRLGRFLPGSPAGAVAVRIGVVCS